jgi:hypothetical protein
MQQYNSHNLSLIDPIEPKTCIITMINMQLKSAVDHGKRVVFKVSEIFFYIKGDAECVI